MRNFRNYGRKYQGGWAGWAALAGGVLGAMNGSKQSGNVTNTSTTAPWAGAQPYLNTAMQSAEVMRQNPSADFAQGVNMQAQRARQGSPLNQAAQQNNLQTLQGDFLSADSNPYLRGAVNTAMGDARSQINSQFTGDNYGNSAHQEWLGKGLMNASLPIYAQNYQQERQRQMGAQALAPTLANQDYTDIGQLQAAGNSQWDQLSKYLSMITGQGSAGTQSSPYFTNPAANAMGGALGGLGLYNSINQNQGQGANNYNAAGTYQPYYSGYDSSGGPAYG